MDKSPGRGHYDEAGNYHYQGLVEMRERPWLNYLHPHPLFVEKPVDKFDITKPFCCRDGRPAYIDGVSNIGTERAAWSGKVDQGTQAMAWLMTDGKCVFPSTRAGVPAFDLVNKPQMPRDHVTVIASGEGFIEADELRLYLDKKLVTTIAAPEGMVSWKLTKAVLAKP